MTTNPPTIIDVRIETPSASAHEYTVEDGSRTVRLVRTVRSDETFPADWAVVPGTLTPSGEPLGALVVTDLPCSPGTIASVRLVGQAIANGERFPIAVLQDDASVRAITSWRQLDPGVRSRIDRLLIGGHADGDSTVAWRDPVEAARTVKEARRAARLAQAEHHAARTRPPAWKALAPFSAGAELAHSSVEQQLLQLPFRFQEYVGRLLVPEERILAFVPRPSDHPRVRFPFRRRHGREEGLLVVTDHQVLWVRDVLKAPIDLMGYGFVARSLPLERLGSAHLQPRGPEVDLVVKSRPAGGAPWWMSVSFPDASVGLVRQALSVLAPFASQGGTTALMRVARPPEDERPLVDLVEGGDEPTRGALDAWQRHLSMTIDPSERIVARAIIPRWGATDGVARLWLATDERVLEIRSDAAPGAGARSWPAATVLAVRLTYSVFESSLDLEHRAGEEVASERIVFPLACAADFVALFVAIRRIMVSRGGFGPEGRPGAFGPRPRGARHRAAPPPPSPAPGTPPGR